MAAIDAGLPIDFQFHFDGSSLFLGAVNCLDYSDEGFVPLPTLSLERRLRSAFPVHVDCSIWEKGLSAICHAMNEGDLAKAGFLVAYLPSPRIIEDGGSLTRSGAFYKASVDDPKHPGWPKGAPDGKGGEFRGVGDGDNLRLEIDGRQRSEGLKSRRQLRSILRRILTAKRVWRLAAEIAGDALPVDFVAEAATIADLTLLAREISADIKLSEAAITFVEKGPQDLAALTVDAKNISFASYPQFLKGDVDHALEKRYGKAGEGYEYHHIVEQGSNAEAFTQSELQSTSNIIRLPKIIHEDVSAIFGETYEFSSGKMPLRAYLRGKTFEQQHAWGVWALQRAGVLK